MFSELKIFQRLNIQNWQIHRDRKETSGCQGLEVGRKRYGVYIRCGENVLALVVMAAQFTKWL